MPLFSDIHTTPTRLLISGEDTSATALDIAARLQGVDSDMIINGIAPDTLYMRDDGMTLKIAYSDAARRDNQSEHQNVRGLIRWAAQSPAGAPWRLVVIEHVERFTRDASHALLKLIEEPSPRTRFIWTTKNHHQLLDTIRSRMSIVIAPSSTHVRESVADDAKDLVLGRDIIAKMKTAERVIKATKDAKSKKVLWELYEDMLHLCRTHPEARQYLPRVWQAYRAAKQNANQRFALEHLALDITA